MKSVVSDFEKAVVGAVRLELPHAKHDGCLFHLRQSMKRNLGDPKYNLTKLFLSDASFKRSFNVLSSLAFVPPEDVLGLFDKVVADPSFHPALKNYAVNYFKNTYILQLDGTTPQYSIPLWNCFERYYYIIL